MQIDQALSEKLYKLITAMGFELYGLRLRQDGSKLVFEVFIDTQSGVTSDECAEVSLQVSALLDVEDPIQGAYVLEVQSPGVDRPLFAPEHYEWALGERIYIRLHVPLEKRRQFKGVVKKVEDENISLKLDDTEEEITVPYSSIEKGHVIGEVNF